MLGITHIVILVGPLRSDPPPEPVVVHIFFCKFSPLMKKSGFLLNALMCLPPPPPPPPPPPNNPTKF